MELLLSKEALRNRMNISRENISKAQRENWSETIAEKIQAHEAYKSAKNVMIYAALPDEVDLSATIDALHASGKKVILPRMNDNTLEAYVVTKNSELVIGAYTVLEPATSEDKVEVEDIDLVLVPGVAFDNKGRRLGRGKGYYDSFLANVDAVKIGIAFDFQIMNTVPTEEHDERMDFIITDRREVQC